MLTDAHWYGVKDGDIRSRWLYERHYSCINLSARKRKGKRNLIIGPGEKMLLRTADGLAVFSWRKFKSKDGQQGVNCSIFRNEGPHLSSKLILEAEQLAWEKWPGERLYTYVDPAEIASANPGYCFLAAGWKHAGHVRRRQTCEKCTELDRPCGTTKKRGLIILEKTS